MKLTIILVGLLMIGGCSSSQKSKDMKAGELYYSKGTHALSEKDYTEALRNYLLAVKYSPEDSDLHNNLGMTYFFKNKMSLAIDHLKKSLQYDQDNTAARNNLASLYLTVGDIDNAQKQYEKVLENLVYPYHFRTYYNLALVALRKNDQQLAEEYFLKSLNEKPSHCPAHFRYGLLLKEQQRFEKALESFQKARLGECHQYPAPLLEEGLVLSQLERYTLAEKKLAEYISKYPSEAEYPMARRALAKIRYQLRKSQDDLKASVKQKNYWQGQKKIESPQF